MKIEVPLHLTHRLLAGRPACLLTVSYRGQVNVMTVAWVCPVSIEPPLVAMAIHPASYTHDVLRRSEECVLNVPARPLLEQTQACGVLSGANEDKIAATGLTLETGRRLEAPWVHECIAHLECGIVSTWSPGDHTIYAAQIVGAWAEEEAFCETWLAPQDNEELLPFYHLGGRTFGLLGPSIKLP